MQEKFSQQLKKCIRLSREMSIRKQLFYSPIWSNSAKYSSPKSLPSCKQEKPNVSRMPLSNDSWVIWRDERLTPHKPFINDKSSVKLFLDHAQAAGTLNSKTSAQDWILYTSKGQQVTSQSRHHVGFLLPLKGGKPRPRGLLGVHNGGTHVTIN